MKQSVKGINTKSVEEEPDVFNKFYNRCLGYVWVSVINSVKIPYSACVFDFMHINEIFRPFLTQYSINNMFFMQAGIYMK